MSNLYAIAGMTTFGVLFEVAAHPIPAFFFFGAAVGFIVGLVAAED